MKYITLLFFAAFNICGFSQNKLTGRYNSRSHIFETSDTTYHISYFTDGIATITAGGYVGLVDTSGTVLLAPCYDRIFPFEGNAAITGLNNKYGLVDRKGKELLAPFAIEIRKFSQGVAVYRTQDSWMYGLVSETGKFVTEKVYSFISEPKAGVFVYGNEETTGLLTPAGREIALIMKPWDEEVLKESVIQLNGHSAGLFDFTEGMALFYRKTAGNYKVGCIDSTGKQVIAPNFDWIEPFRNGLAPAEKNGKWGAINRMGETVVPFEYASLTCCANERFIVSRGGKYGVVGKGGAIILPLSYPVLYELYGDLFINRNSEKFGVVNASGKQVIPFGYEGILATGPQSGIVSKYIQSVSWNTGVPRYTFYGEYTYFDSTGKLDSRSYPFSIPVEGISDWYAPGQLFHLSPSFFTPRAVPGIRAIYTDSSEQYDIDQPLKSGYRIVGKIVQQDQGLLMLIHPSESTVYRKGILDPEGKEVLPLEYDDIVYDGRNLMVFRKGNKYGVVSDKGEIVLPAAYQYIEIGAASIILHREIQPYEWETAVTDLRGRILLPFGEKSIREAPAGTWMQQNPGSSFAIDKKGNRLTAE